MFHMREKAIKYFRLIINFIHCLGQKTMKSNVMALLSEIVNFCSQRISVDIIKDFSGAYNGLQVENNGLVTKIGAAVDAGLVPFRKASEEKIDFLIVHHGLFWNPPIPFIGPNYDKVKHCIDKNLAVYGAHLPLDCHPEIGNNAILASQLNLSQSGTFLNYEGHDIGLITECSISRKELSQRLKELFPQGIHKMEYGSSNPSKIAILTGSGQSAFDEIKRSGADTFITGELKQHHFNLAQELSLNVYTCGHYATEIFGVKSLGEEVAAKFDLPFKFIDTACPI